MEKKAEKVVSPTPVPAAYDTTERVNQWEADMQALEERENAAKYKNKELNVTKLERTNDGIMEEFKKEDQEKRQAQIDANREKVQEKMMAQQTQQAQAQQPRANATGTTDGMTAKTMGEASGQANSSFTPITPPAPGSRVPAPQGALNG